MASDGPGDLEATLLSPRGGEQSQPYGSGLKLFLVQHYLPLLAQLWLMRTAWLSGYHLVLGSIMVVLTLSGILYSYVAWHATVDTGLFGKSYLPLRDQPCPLVVLLFVPYGVLQWVVVRLRVHSDASGGLRADGEDGEDSRLVSYNNYKAVSAIIESIVTSAALLHTHWTTGLLINFRGHTLSLTLSQLVIVASGGLGLMQVDFCCSLNVRKRAKNPWYMCLHGLLRTCEVVSRLSILTGFAVMATTKSPWWWLLIATEFSISACLVLVYGGVRNTAVANVVCAISATIVNVFCFVDSPPRFECAHNISWFLTLKHFVETALALLSMICVMNLSWDLHLHSISLGTAMITTVVYWLLFVFLCRTWRQETEPRDNIFSACRRGDEKVVQQLISQGELLDKFDVFGMTPLMHAATGGHADLCRLLVAQGASPLHKAMGEWRRCVKLSRWVWEPAGRKWTAMHFAAWRDHVSVLQVLLGAACAQPLKWMDVYNNTPLHVAGQFKHDEAFELIWRRGPKDWRTFTNGSNEAPSNPNLDVDDCTDTSDDPSDQAPPAPPEEAPVAARGAEVPLPLGLTSFMMGANSEKFGPGFVPEPMLSKDAVEPGLRLEDLTPCRADGTRLQDSDRSDPNTWGANGICVGKGTYGVVGRACDKHGKLYAVKVLETDGGDLLRQGDLSRQLALREAQAALSVRNNPHPCLVEVFFYNDLGTRIYIVASFCNRGTLQDAVKECARNLPRRTGPVALDYQPKKWFELYLAEVYLGMEHVHRGIKGIIRDLKPDNVGLHAHAPAPGQAEATRAMLLDYGGYRLTGPSSGVHSMGNPYPQGTPGYAAPEVLSGIQYDKSADFYSFGVLAWVVLTGGLFKSAVPPISPTAKHLPPAAELKAYAGDWQKLRKYVRSAADADEGQRKLSKEEAKLLLGLIKEEGSKRLGNQDVRSTLGAMLRRPLPAYDLPPAELEAWLAEAEASAFAAGS